MKKKRIVKIGIMLFMIIGMCGCAKLPVENDNSTEESTEWKEMETENIQCAVYKAKVHEVSQELLVELFASQREETLSQEKESQFYKGKTAYSYWYEDETRLYMDCGVLTFNTKEYENYPIQYFLDEKIASEIFPEGVEMVCPQKDLWFMTYQDAERLVSDYLEQLGIEYGADWTGYSITGTVLTEAVNRRYPQDEYEADVSFGYGEVKREFGEEDDIFLFWIPLAIEGHELSAEGIYAANQTYQLPAGWAQAIVGSTGLWYLEVWHSFDQTGIIETGNIISDGSAVKLAEEYCSHLLGVGEIKLENQGLHYVPEIKTVMTADAFELYPAWLIEATTETGASTLLYVDALTGEVK